MGFLADMQREAARQAREQEREARRVQREFERSQREAQRLAAQQEKERKRLYTESRIQETESLNSELQLTIEGLENLLDATLTVDDYIDLDQLKAPVVDPPFNDRGYGTPKPRPQFVEPEPPSKFQQFMLAGKAKHEAAVQVAKQEHEAALEKWAKDEKQREAALEKLQVAHQQEVKKHRLEIEAENAKIDEFKEKLEAGDAEAVVDYLGMVLEASRYPHSFPKSHKIAYVPESKQVVLEHDLPDFDVVPDIKTYKYVKTRDEITTTARPATQRKALYSSVIAQLALRTAHEIFEADRNGNVDTLVYNGMVDTVDKRTGKSTRVCLISFRVTTDAFEELQLDRVDPHECLKGLNAGVSKSPTELAPVRPVVEFKMVDDRFTDESDILSELDDRPNLMDLTPSEFESLITNLFEKMGLETRQTRPSRDGGVDTVAWDMRPVMGGKVVIQAKRYKNTVGVAAVRDLFGTVHNEGAGKGILVCTSGYGKASFDFADGKPLELIDGNNLLFLLKEHADIDARIIPPEDWVDPEGMTEES